MTYVTAFGSAPLTIARIASGMPWKGERGARHTRCAPAASLSQGKAVLKQVRYERSWWQ